MEPTLNNSTILGDSMFLELALKRADQPPPFPGIQYSWGFCRSDKTVRELHDEISALVGRENKVVVLIGINDVISKSRSAVQPAKERVKIADELYKLKEKLKRKSSKIVWCTIPPIPILIDGPEKVRYEGLLSAANKKIKSFNDDKVAVIDLFAVFEDRDVSEYYERLMEKDKTPRVDIGIRWSDKGVDLAYDAIKQYWKN